MRHRYDVAGHTAIAVGVIRDALDEIGPEPSGRRGHRPSALRLAVRLKPNQKEALRYLIEDSHEIEAWCTLTRLMTPLMVYTEARDRLAYHGLFEPRLDAKVVQTLAQAA